MSGEGDVSGIRITPPIVEFVDASINQSISANLLVQNISKFSKKIRFHAPVTNKFKLTVKNPERPVAPGLEICALVEFMSETAEDARDRIILSVDDDIIEIPLYAYTPTPLLDLEGPVNFGMVVANSRVLSQEVALINHGSLAGDFSIECDSSLPIVITPTSGKVNPKTIQLIKVELVTETPGNVNEVAKVKLEGMQETKLEIKACIVEQSLELLANDSQSQLKCVAFGPAYYGTDRIEPAFLFNNGPEPIKWVSILEEGAAGEEAGTDLTKSTAAMLATSPMEKIRGRAFDILTSLITVFPNQGQIGPYEKVPVYFRFSPRFNSSSVGWEATEKPPPRQDFALFMRFEMVGSNDTFLCENINPNKQVEVAVTATATPVLVNIQPNSTFDFGELMCGDYTSSLCTLTNESSLLPISISCRKVAHFNVTPVLSKIKPGQSRDILLSFQPNQAGTFEPLQLIDVLGKVCATQQEKGNSRTDVTKLSVRPFQTIPIQLVGTSIAIPKHREPRINPGITPHTTNETGQYPDVSFGDVTKVKGQVRPTVANTANTTLHSAGKKRTEGTDHALVAFPNDRAQSIRPSKRGEEYQTPYTRSQRHTYTDPDYAYTIEEEEARRSHKDKYKQFLRESGEKRRKQEQNKEFKEISNDKDLSLKPAAGLRPPKISARDIETPAPHQIVPPNDRHRLLTTRQLANQERQATTRAVSEGLNAVPTSHVEKTDCKRILTPQDLHKVIIGPPTIDFGEICLRSTNQKQLHIVNNLDHYIHVQVMIDCKELRQTSPLSQVIPSQSKAQFTLVFESNAEGKFQRSISYTVNSQHEAHVLVLANVVPVALQLSTDFLELNAEQGLPAEAGYRSVVTLHNRRNHAADFTWSPVLTDRGTAFSIRPATGTVGAFQHLKCEVVFHPSYFAPLEGEFHLQVYNGNSLKLKCLAKLGATNVQFVERRILFGNVPLNMRTTRTALLHNSGHNHAMFYVINSNPFPGMTVSPVHGVVPIGGNTELKIVLSPSAVVKFDTWIQVNIRGWKTIDLRMGGTVEPPEVDIDIKAFKFSGVYCGSNVTMPFNLVNLTSTRVRADFDLSRYSDFTLSFPEEELDDNPNDQEQMNPNNYSVELVGQQKLACVLSFKPSAVASYDFTLPVVINKTGAPSPTPSTFPPTPAPSERHIITPRPILINIPTPRRRVVATALRPILDLSEARLDFSLPVSYMEMSVPDNAGGDRKYLTLSNKSNSPLKWQLDVEQADHFSSDAAFAFLKPGGAWFQLEDVSGQLGPGTSVTITVVFCPTQAGSLLYKIPVILNDDKLKPYRHLTLSALLQPPHITFDPLALVLTPVPLATAVYAEFNVVASGYGRDSTLKVEVPDAEADDGSTVHCFSVDFPNGPNISLPKSFLSSSAEKQVSVVVPCVMTFSSDKPVSATVDLTFTDDAGRRFSIPVTATADNCLLTVYPFLAAHRSDHQIVCEQDKQLRGLAQDANSTSLGEAVLLPCVSPQRPSTRGSTSATSSHFGATSTSFESSNTASGSTSTSSYYISVFSDCSDSPAASLTFKSCSSIAESEFAPSSRDGAQPAVPAHSDTTVVSNVRSNQQVTKAATHDVASLQKRITLNQREAEDAQRELVSRSLGSAVFPFESSMEAHFHQEVLQAAQRWFSVHGWPGGPFPVSVPQSLRRLVTRVPYDDDQGGVPAKRDATGKRPPPTLGGWDTNLKKDVKTIYDMLQHLCGRMVPGIPINQPLPRDPTERVVQLHWQHSTLLTFLRGQGASVSAIRPEFLLTPRDYRRWVKVRERETKQRQRSDVTNNPDDDESEVESKVKVTSTVQIEDELFESVSKRAWTDLLLQLFKVLVLSRITPKQYLSLKPLDKNKPLPKVNPDPLASNVYSTGERIVLAWLNHHYEQQRHQVWGDTTQDLIRGSSTPPSRWVVNFDYDLLDGLVLAAALAAYCPWLITQYFSEMYTAPASPEQCLHNTLILVRALRSVGVDYDMQATDITDPNPIALLMLCVYLYQNLPQYAPKSCVEFVGSLHAAVRRQVRLTNPSSKPLKYVASIAGRDASDFKLPGGDEVLVPPRGEVNLDVQFTSRLIRPAEAVLVLVGRREAVSTGYTKSLATVGSTLVFTMRTAVDDIHPVASVKVETPCYELCKVLVPVNNTFGKAGKFRIVLVESGDGPPSPLDIGNKQRIVRSVRKSLSSRIKSVKSRTDHGQAKDPSPPPSPPPEERPVPGASAARPTMTSQLTAFYCHDSHVYLEPGHPADIQLEFLPFSVGRKHCSVLLVNEDIGESLYAVEGVSGLPLPSAVPFNPASNHAVRISSAAAAEKGKGLFGGDERVIYWKCENNLTLHENLLIPVTNLAKERALRLAARQRMSEKEQTRRQLTGTLDSGSVTAAVAAMNLVETENYSNANFNNNSSELRETLSNPIPPKGVTFSVHATSEWYEVTDVITIPSPMTFGPPPASEMRLNKMGPNDRQDDGSVPLEVNFTPHGPGHYPCDIVLKSPGDVRLFRIECTVNPAGTNAKFDFRTPAHQSITQSIPIQNASNHDWELMCTVEGSGFHGPRYMLAKAGQTTYYPLMFKPHVECSIAGNLTIKNKSDGTEHIFSLRGVGESPLSLEHLEISATCRETCKRSVKVPNFSANKLTYKVFSDLPFLDGANAITVMKGEAEEYEFALSPWQRGVTTGVLAFVVDDDTNLMEVPEHSKSLDTSKTPNFLRPKHLSEIEGLSGYRVWYSIEVNTAPADPIGVLEVTCPVQRSKTVEIPIKNPSADNVKFEVQVSGTSVSGENSLSLAPRVPATYRFQYAPCLVGQNEGSVVFCSELTGEFWYKLLLKCVSPPPTHLPMMDCQLGSWSRQFITISNPSDEPIDVEASISNGRNFSLDIPPTAARLSDGSERPPCFCVQPRSGVDIPVQFMPTSLGASTHQTTVTLRSKHLGEAVYLAAGRGLAPAPMEPLSVSAATGSSTSLILPFRNPTDVAVLADVTIRDRDQTINRISSSVIRNSITADSAFCLLLKHTSNIKLQSRQTIDIPFTFAPDAMRRHEGALTISLRREDGRPWPDEHDGIEDLSGLNGKSEVNHDRLRSLSRGDDGSVKAIRWVFPVHGIPEVRSTESKEATLHCQARSRIEERLEVTLTGAVPSSSSGHNLARLRAVTPLGQQRRSSGISDGVAVEGHAVADEFSHRIEYADPDARLQLEQALAVSIVRMERDPHSGVVLLLFNLVFSPFRMLSHTVNLTVTSATGGIWSFPLTLTATEPPPDDVINVEAAGLGKSSTVSFVLFSHSKHATPYNAFFVAGSDPELSVSPESGELLPQGTNGTRLNLSFTPTMYGRSYKARLIVQTLDMQWTYDVKGITPEYHVPNVQSAILASTLSRPRPLVQRPRVNYVRKNIKLSATAVSSPIKGTPLVTRITSQ